VKNFKGGAKMEFPDNHIIEELYSSGMVTDVSTSKAYKELLGEYNDLYDTIEDKNLRDKLEKLEEMKNKLYSETDKDIFKCGFSMATKMIMEALTTNM